jgi:hypothetical protein
MNIRFMPLCFALLVIIFTIPACGNGDSPTGGGPQDTTAPAIASVTAIDTYHLQVVFDEPLARSTAEGPYHYSIEEPVSQPVQGSGATRKEPIFVFGASLADDQRTVTLTTNAPMAGVEYNLAIWGIKDVAGNLIDSATHSFVGNAAADVTPPQLVSLSPGSGAMNVPIGVPVVAKFSESVSVGTATWIADGDTVRFEEWAVDNEFRMLPNHLLAPGSHHTVTLADVQDISGNVMPDIAWSFTVATGQDNTPPRLISSLPANLASNVSTHSNISLTFSEPLNPLTRFVTIYPSLDVFVLGFLENGGKTLVVETSGLLKDNQQYTIALEPAYFLDLAGNSLDHATTITFTTGSNLAHGSISGRITGDPGTGAADPSGASIIAEAANNVAGNVVAPTDAYNLEHLADGLYQVMAVKDSNHDGTLDFYRGDAIGIYGVSLEPYDVDPDSVQISSGAQIGGINFPIYDPSAVWGTLSYSGPYRDGFAYVAMFKTAGFDPHNPSNPVAVSDAWRDEPWYFSSLGQEIPDGDYYLAAYIDVNEDGLNLGVDPYGWYGGPGAPIAVHLANGSDAGDIVIKLSDPMPGIAISGQRHTWRKTKLNSTFKHFGDLIRTSQEQAAK